MLTNQDQPWYWALLYENKGGGVWQEARNTDGTNDKTSLLGFI